MPHTPSPGGTQPWHPDTHTFPMALPLGTTAHGPGATCQGHSTCAGSTCGGQGHLHPLRDRSLCGEGAQGDLEQLLIPVGSRIWHPHHTQELPALKSGTGKGNAPHIPCWGLSHGLGAPLGLPVQLQCGTLPAAPHCWLLRILGGDPAMAILCTRTSWICP